MYAIPGQTTATPQPEPVATAPTPRSVAQVLAESNVLAVLDELEREKWQSNQRFAQSLVHRRAPKKGAAVVVQELRRHGVADDDVAAIHDQLRVTEYDRAKAVWQRKFGAPPADSKEYARHMRFLASRGFSPAILRRILGDLDDFPE